MTTTTTTPTAARSPSTDPPPPGLPRRVLIANRGEIVVRIARTCREVGIGTVAVFSDVDADALHVRACDQAVRLGGASPADSYLRTDALLDAAARSGADAVHPGYGFLSENAAFARAVTDAGLTWIGPSADVIATMGDKVAAKRAMAEAGVPLVPGAELPPSADVAAIAAEVGFPLLVKAAAGGGGKGMRIVADPAGLAVAVAAARREAAGAFGDDTVFLERYVERSRHVEVQILGDTHGNLVHAFERECSIQRRHQKVVEEAPAPGIDAEVRAALCAAAVDAARALGYVSAGTVEFIADEARRCGEPVDPRDCFAFLEVNTRLQVEHPVTEESVRVRDAAGVLGPLDLVREQLLVAGGAALTIAQDDLVQTGHAIEVRLYAEDPTAGYLPQSGPLHAFAPAAPVSIRWDAGVVAGDVVSTHYDPMLAKVIAAAPTRAEAAARLNRALDDTVLLGITTNRDLLVAVLSHPAFLTAATTTDFLDIHLPDGVLPPPDDATVEVAVIAVTLARVLRDRPGNGIRASVPPGFTSAGTFAPQVTVDVLDTALRHLGAAAPDPPVAGELADLDVAATGHEVRVHEVAGGHRAPPGARRGRRDAADTRLDVEVNGCRQRVRVTSHQGRHVVATATGRVRLDERPRFPSAEAEVAAGATLAPMPGSVVADGQPVARGELLCTVEAMKMEHRVTAPLAGEVTEVRVATGQQVDADDILVVVAPAEDTDIGDTDAAGAGT
jgi:acetyl/propionyl-CoA carboxylase alpha subunit